MSKLPFLPFFIAIMLPSYIDADEKKVVVAFSELPPWKIVQEGEFKGAYAELAREIANHLDLQIEFQLCSLKRCLHMMKMGAADIIIGINPTSERKEYIKFLSTPYRSSSTKVFYMRSNEQRELKVYDDLYNFEHIGVKSGARYFDTFDTDPYLNKAAVSTNSQNFSKLLHLRINLLIINQEQGEHFTNALGITQQIKKADFTVKTKTHRYLGISKKSKHIQDFQLFEAAMSKIASSGALEAIIHNSVIKNK